MTEPTPTKLMPRRRRRKWIGAALAFAAWTPACFDPPEDVSYRIFEPRILAIRPTPAEARPNQEVSYEALIAAPDGSLSTQPDFAFCLQARRAENRRSVSEACLLGESLQPIAAQSTMLPDACARFGPNTPPAASGDAAARPSDPDPSGGYYVPVEAISGDSRVFGQHRVRCDLAGATRSVFQAFQDTYQSNTHPEIQTLDAPSTAAPGGSHVLRLMPTPSSFETYPIYRLELGALIEGQETLQISWYLSDGTLSSSRQTLSAGDAPSELVWTAPSDAQEVNAWVVVVDDRGGVTWESFQISVRQDSPQ